jgi:uncharacterized protein
VTEDPAQNPSLHEIATARISRRALLGGGIAAAAAFDVLLAADPATGDIRRFLVGPRGCEITGVTLTPDQETMFLNIQHPGEATPAVGAPTPTNPRAVSNWPDFDPAGRPRSVTVVIRKEGGGKIGT